VAAIDQQVTVLDWSGGRGHYRAGNHSVHPSILMAEFKTLQFANNARGQAEKIRALTEHSRQGWRVAAETITPGKFKGSNACCLTMGGLACCGPFGAPAGLAAGHDEGTINVTLTRD
jgi:hypothetical protein